MSQATFLTSTIHVRFQYKQQVDHIKINMSVFSAYFSLLCKLNKFYERKEMTERIFYEFLWKFEVLTAFGSYQRCFKGFIVWKSEVWIKILTNWKRKFKNNSFWVIRVNCEIQHPIVQLIEALNARFFIFVITSITYKNRNF